MSRTFEDAEREYQEWMATPIPKAKPKPVAVVSVPVSDKDAEVIASNPESVRVSARRADGVTVLAKPESNSLNVTVRTDLVRDVNAYGQPVWDEPGVVSDYHPWQGLRR